MNENKNSPLAGKRIVIAGGSGFLGRACTRHLHALGAEVVVLSRREPGFSGKAGFERVRRVDWSGGPAAWHGWLDGADGIVNMIGRSVNCRKTPAHCDAILRSRVDSVRLLGKALGMVDKKPPVWVQSSTAHIYGDPAECHIGDDATTGWGLAPDVGRAWEAAFADNLPAGTRGVLLRTGFVIGREGGALPVLARLARLGLGGKAGHGRQGFSWIHTQDFCRIVERALLNPGMDRTWNVTAPVPVSQAGFMRSVREAVGMPIGLPAPEWLIRLGARWIMDTDPDLILEGRYIIPTRLMETDFTFAFPRLDEALRDLLG